MSGFVAATYDPLGRMNVITSGANYTKFDYDGNSLIAEYSFSNALLRRYVHGPGVDEPLVWYEYNGSGTPERRWLHADERGSVIAVSNSSSEATGTFAYDENGMSQGASFLRFRYTGQAWLTELDMYYYRARMYSPSLGRFMQTDPIGYGDGMNLYAYVHNDPVNFIDPLGLSDQCSVFQCGSPIFSTGSRPTRLSGIWVGSGLAARFLLDAPIEGWHGSAIAGIGEGDTRCSDESICTTKQRGHHMSAIAAVLISVATWAWAASQMNTTPSPHASSLNSARSEPITFFDNGPFIVDSPNGQFRIASRPSENGQISLSVINTRTSTTQTIGQFEPPTAILWSPQSNAFFVNDQKGSGQTSFLIVFHLNDRRFERSFAAQENLVGLHNTLFRCHRSLEEISTTGQRWLNPQRIVVGVQANLHTPGCALDPFSTNQLILIVDSQNGQIVTDVPPRF